MMGDGDFNLDDERDHALIEALRSFGITVSFAEGAIELESGGVSGVYSSRVFCPVVALPGVPDGVIRVRLSSPGNWEIVIGSVGHRFSEKEINVGMAVPK